MRSATLAAICLLALGLFAAPTPAETYVMPVPDLEGQYISSVTELQDIVDLLTAYSDLTAGASPYAGLRFSSISQVRVRLQGTMHPTYVDPDPIEGTGGDAPTPMVVQAAGGSETSANLNGAFDFTLTFPVTQPTASMLAGRFDLGVYPSFEPMFCVGRLRLDAPTLLHDQQRHAGDRGRRRPLVAQRRLQP